VFKQAALLAIFFYRATLCVNALTSRRPVSVCPSVALVYVCRQSKIKLLFDLVTSSF